MKSKTNQPVNKRRRGKLLEDDILKATWDELAVIGYTNLTMDKIAMRAKTNKAVLYRRYANKSDIVVAALRKYLPKPDMNIPNIGDLRSDVFAFLHNLAQPFQSIGAETISGLIIEYVSKNKDFIASIPRIVHPETAGKLSIAMTTILRNAEARGEINLQKISPRVAQLPFDLFRFELITSYKPVSDQAISEIVDDIFMPLIRNLTDRTE